MIMYEMIRKKRDGEILSDDEINDIIDAYTKNSIPDYQMSALLMAIYLNGMTTEETAALTKAMLNSGTVLDFSEFGTYIADKHSTGGVGDKLSLIIGPIVASLGISIPMIAGRGLGHTGGTLDKLESITGFSVDHSALDIKRFVKETNIAIIGQTEDLAPADKKIYALRDVTATVASIPLITASIMSKKLAEGLNGLVMDVKYGSGAFMEKPEDAITLAKSIVNTGRHAGTDVLAFLTAMDQPLGTHIGNWLEIIESVESLKGNGPEDTMRVTHVLSGAMIYMAGKSKTIEDGITLSKTQIENGEAYRKFLEIVKNQGGDVFLVENIESYKTSKYSIEIKSPKSGYITKMNAMKIGVLSVNLKAGRQMMTDKIDFTAGFILHSKVGDFVNESDVIASAFYDLDMQSEDIINTFLEAIDFSETKPEPIKLILGMVDKDGNFKENLNFLVKGKTI